MTRRPRGTSRVRSEPRPGWGTVAPQKSPSLPFRGLCPTPISTVTYLAGTKCSQGSRDTGRFRIGRPVPAPRRVLRDLEPRPGAGWAAPACHSVQEAQDSLAALPPPPGDPGPASARVGLRDCGWEPNPAVPSDWVVGGVGSQLGGVKLRGLRGRNAAHGLCQLYPASWGAPDLVQNSLSEGDRAERSRRASRASSAAAQLGPQGVRPVPGPLGDSALLLQKKILELGLAL